MIHNIRKCLSRAHIEDALQQIYNNFDEIFQKLIQLIDGLSSLLKQRSQLQRNEKRRFQKLSSKTENDSINIVKYLEEENQSINISEYMENLETKRGNIIQAQNGKKYYKCQYCGQVFNTHYQLGGHQSWYPCTKINSKKIRKSKVGKSRKEPSRINGIE